MQGMSADIPNDALLAASAGAYLVVWMEML
jgi:hypothetical protein